MPRTDEAEWWTNAVYAAVQEIPRGKVTSYGHIALLLGQPQRPRQVGISLKYLPRGQGTETETETETGTGIENEEHEYEYFTINNVPWQRVINAKGMISHREPGSAQNQAQVLRSEGVEVDVDAMGDMYVDFGRFGWFPLRLPSEGGNADEDDHDNEANEGG